MSEPGKSMKGRAASAYHALLLSDKPPFAISIYFAAIAWVFTHSITVISDQKLIEYGKAVVIKSDRLLYEVTLRNISNFRYDALEFIIESEHLEQDSDFTNIIAVAPAILANEEVYEYGRGEVTFKIDSFHPGQEYKLVAEYKGTTRPVFRFKSNLSKASTGEKKPIRMIESSAWTWGIRHQGELITLFVVVWGIATFWTLSVAISVKSAGGQVQ